MKYVKLEVTRSESTELYIEVPDDFDESVLMLGINAPEIARIADDTTDSMDWDNYGWESTIEVQSVKKASEDEAKQYMVGKLSVDACKKRTSKPTTPEEIERIKALVNKLNS